MYKKNKFLAIIFVLLGFSILPSPSFSQDISLGEKTFNECRACHSLEANINLIGPSLAGVVNRQIASLENYRYSKALKNSNGIWDNKTLNAFLENPQAAYPGNRMPYSGLSNPTDRKALIEYLTTFKP